MADNLANKFITAIDPVRDHLYGLALTKEPVAPKAEALLQKTIRTLFPDFAKDPYIDAAGAMEKALDPDAAARATAVPMPADVWARLAAAIQIEAAKSTHSRALNPDSVLLSPDPLLAPKKANPADDPEGLDLSPPSRFLLAAGIAILVGIALTIYILTRPAAPSPTTAPATTTPHTAPAP